MALTLTERQADIWRTAAAIIYDAARGECGDLRTLMLREGDGQYHGTVASCVAAAFVQVAKDCEIRNPLVDQARRVCEWADRDVNEQAAVKAAHHFAHAFVTVGLAYHGADGTIARTHLLVERLAVGDYGPGIEVE